MEYVNKLYCVEIAGDFALFTRPEMKVERVSYDVITPSAARGILQAIFWKPAIRWIVRKIEVLNEIRWISVRRNELDVVMSRSGGNGIFIEENRQQRAGLLLRDVRYRLHAELEFIHPRNRVTAANTIPEALNCESEDYGKDENPGKYYAIFERRMRKGQCFNHPYLGCREFSCSSFRLVGSLDAEPRPIGESKELGFMLYDLDYSDASNPRPMFFRARLENGVVVVPSPDSEEVRR